MKFGEAMKLLEEGKKVRKEAFGKDGYLYKGDLGNIVNEYNIPPSFWTIDGEWEEYIEETEETEESNYGIQDRLSMILENQDEIKAGVQAILKWFAIETEENKRR